MALLSSVRIIDATILQQNNAFFFLFGDAFSDKNTNTFILEATENFMSFYLLIHKPNKLLNFV